VCVFKSCMCWGCPIDSGQRAAASSLLFSNSFLCVAGCTPAQKQAGDEKTIVAAYPITEAKVPVAELSCQAKRLAAQN